MLALYAPSDLPQRKDEERAAVLRDYVNDYREAAKQDLGVLNRKISREAFVANPCGLTKASTRTLGKKKRKIKKGCTFEIVRACIDAPLGACENGIMKPVETILTPHNALADLEYALHLQATGQRDTAFEKRISEHTEKIRQEILAEKGVLNVAVDLIREGRDAE